MLTDEDLHGRVVLTSDGLKIGEVTRLQIDPGDFRIRALEVRLDRDAAERIGIQHGVFRAAAIVIPIEQVQSLGDAILLSVPVDGLRHTDDPAVSAGAQRAPAP